MNIKEKDIEINIKIQKYTEKLKKEKNKEKQYIYHNKLRECHRIIRFNNHFHIL
jgi:hypothetical protein